LFISASAHAADTKSSNAGSKLSIARDRASGKITVSWTGKGVLEEAPLVDGGVFSPVPKKGPGSSIVLNPKSDKGVLRLKNTGAKDGDVYSQNIVGYVTTVLPPGLSLIANPLIYSTNYVSVWWPNAPDGSQIFKYTVGSGYEVTTFDAQTGVWSNPFLDIPIGTGFYFRNPSSSPITNTFVGELWMGTLINPLPAGYSTKGALIPMAGSINTVQLIPGQPGDELRTYVNDGQGGGYELISTFDGTANAWVPDQNLNVAQGFWIHKQNPQDWVRVLSITP